MIYNKNKYVCVDEYMSMKRIFSLLLAGWLVLPAVAVEKMRDVFAAMPDSVLGLMTKNNRLDCIDFIENNMEAKVRNRFDGYTVLTTMTDDYMDLQLTASCRVEMKLLPVADSLSYVCMVCTYSSPVPESVLALYTTDWKAVASDIVPEKPAYEAFWHTNDTMDVEEVKALQHLQDMRFVTAQLNKDDLSLTFTLQPGEVDKEPAERMKAVLRPVTYRWSNGKFVYPE